MKGITEMTEQEILALTEEDVQKLIKLRMMEEGIKIMDKPEVPELLYIVFLYFTCILFLTLFSQTYI